MKQRALMSTHRSTKDQLTPFALVGIVTTILHFIIVIFLVSLLHVSPLIANGIAFAISVNASFFGHKYYTFSHLPKKQKLRYPHFMFIAFLSFLLNELLYFLFLDYTVIDYRIALVLVIGIVAIFTFFASKYWACR